MGMCNVEYCPVGFSVGSANVGVAVWLYVRKVVVSVVVRRPSLCLHVILVVGVYV